jgi:hypothetical protein
MSNPNYISSTTTSSTPLSVSSTSTSSLIGEHLQPPAHMQNNRYGAHAEAAGKFKKRKGKSTMKTKRTKKSRKTKRTRKSRKSRK